MSEPVLCLQPYIVHVHKGIAVCEGMNKQLYAWYEGEGGEKSNKTNRRSRRTISFYTVSTPHLCLLMASQHILFKIVARGRVMLVASLRKVLWGLVEKVINRGF